MATIALVDDDENILASLKVFFEQEGYAVDVLHDGTEAGEQARAIDYDVVVLDLMLPGMNGFEVCRMLRPEQPALWIIMLTVRGQEVDRVTGFEAGADDYVTKPFSLRELVGRIKVGLRRAPGRSAGRRATFGDVDVDLAAHVVKKADVVIELTPKEFDLAATFFRNVGRLLSRGYLQETVWGRMGDLATRTVDTHVSQVRKKLDLHPESGYRIVPIYNYGYRLERLSTD